MITPLITLHDIDPDNHVAVRALRVHPHQERFVASVDKSLADAKVWQTAIFKAAYENDVPVGFVLIFPYEEEGKHIINIVRVMIDMNHQGRGLGTALMQATLNWIDDMKADRARIATLPDNDVALRLYQHAGFQEEGHQDGQIVLFSDRPGRSD